MLYSEFHFSKAKYLYKGIKKRILDNSQAKSNSPHLTIKKHLDDAGYLGTKLMTARITLMKLKLYEKYHKKIKEKISVEEIKEAIQTIKQYGAQKLLMKAYLLSSTYKLE